MDWGRKYKIHGEYVFTDMLSFADSQSFPPLAGCRPDQLFSGSLKTSTVKPSTPTVAHRPWEDSIPCVTPWPEDYYDKDLLGGFPGHPKTFKPILLYHRPEESDLTYSPRPCYNHVPIHSCENDDVICCCALCHEEVEESVRELFHSALIHDHLCRMGHGVCESGLVDSQECDCTYGFQRSPLVARVHPEGVSKPYTAIQGCFERSLERTANTCRRCSVPNDALSYPFPVSPSGLSSWSPQNPLASNPRFSFPFRHRARSEPVSCKTPNHHIIPRTSYNAEPIVHQTLPSCARSPHNRFLTTRAHNSFPPKRPGITNSGSASEIRRALLTNHPIHYKNGTCNNAADYLHGQGRGCAAQRVIAHSTEARIHTVNANSGVHAGQGQHLTRTSSTPCVSSGIAPSKGQNLMPGGMIQQPVITVCSSELSTAMIPLLSPVRSGGAASDEPEPQEWQEWAGRYNGSFLQFLNSSGSPGSTETSNSSLSQSPPRLLNNGLSSCIQERDLGEQVIRPDGEGVESSPPEDKDCRKHRCPYCDVTCTNNGQLKGHLRVHSGERPYKCDCGRAFARNEELTRHRRIHSGLRPHVCPICSKRFGRKDHLNKHQKTHLNTSEKKTHACQVVGCQQKYTRSDALARHQWGAHGIKSKTSRIRPVPPAPHSAAATRQDPPAPVPSPTENMQSTSSLAGQDLLAMFS